MKYLTIVLSCLALSGCYAVPYNDGVAPYGGGSYPAYENYYAPSADPFFFSADYYSVGYGRTYNHNYRGGGYYHGGYRNGGYHTNNAGAVHAVNGGANAHVVSGGGHGGDGGRH